METKEMTQVTQSAKSSQPGETHGEGRHTFTFIYDDTGADATVVAPNGWSIRQVVDKAYEELGEAPREDDRVEFDGQSLVPYYGVKVKEFIERGIVPDLRFNIVSNPGGASS
jgi:hypothetical protein